MQEEGFQLPAWLWFAALVMYTVWGVGNAFYGTLGGWLMTLAMILLAVHAAANLGHCAEGTWSKLPYLFYAGVALMVVSLIFS